LIKSEDIFSKLKRDRSFVNRKRPLNFFFFLKNNLEMHIYSPWPAYTRMEHLSHWGSWPGGRRGLSPPAAPGFESSCARLSPPRCLTCPLGLQGVQWVVGLVVVRASWPGHPRKSPKKKKNRTFVTCRFY